MTMFLPCPLLLLAIACLTGMTTAERNAKDSCMVHWMVQAGVSHGVSARAEKRILQLGAKHTDLAQTAAYLLSFLLKTTLAESNKLRACFGGTAKACQKYSACKHAGKCTLSLSKKQHVCNCPLDYTGDFCQILHPAPLRDLRVLEENFKKLTKKVRWMGRKQIQRGKLWKCHFPFVARKHYTWYKSDSGTDNGQLRSVKFVKKQEHTALRLLYSSNIREITGGRHGRWYFKIDGHDCTRPSKIDITTYHDRTNNIHFPAVLLGTCQATARGRIGKGSHTISVHIQSSDGYSGWYSTSFMEIKEICPDK